MQELDRIRRIGVVGLAIGGLLAGNIFAQAQHEETLTGCLTKGSSGNYTLTDERTGGKTIVMGPSELEKHSANHKVKLTGRKTEAAGNPVFEVSTVQHLATSCKAP